MIIGVGIDIVEIERLRATLQRSGERFLDYVFTSQERSDAPESERQRYGYFAARWAAKESLSKALGCGIGAKCGFKDVEVCRDEVGKPSLELSGQAAATAAELGITKLHLSLSHERDYACAIVIAEA
ncbi:MAG: holo-ACP synthase [Oligosphaeraceae bacterium]|nr:holo-ACP synthase [Oligosphaeraceae bacterium]